MAEPRLPNFFVVGAPKAGTTALCRYLDQHADVAMSPIKEPCYFAPEVVRYSEETRARYARERDEIARFLDRPHRTWRQSGFVTEWDQYLKLFRDAGQAAAVGEGSVSYLGSLHAPAAIRARVPDARVVMVLRDPVDRLFSHYKFVRAIGRTDRSLADWAIEQQALEASREIPWGSVWAGRYAGQVARYLETFGTTRVHVILYEDFARDPRGTLAGVFRFLGVDPAHPIDTTVPHNVTAAPRWRGLDGATARLGWRVLRSVLPDAWMRRAKAWSNGAARIGCTRDDRARVIALHAEEIRALERLIGRDLSAWQTV